METLLSGWLVKSPPERKPWNFLKQQWKKRYFVLCQLFTSNHSDSLQLALEYYDSESKCCKKGKIDLENCDDIQSGLICSPYNFVFSMRTKYRGQQRVYYMAAESFEEMDRWVQSLCTVLNHGRPASQCLRQVPSTSGCNLGIYSEDRRRKFDPFSGRRSTFHCSRSGRRPTRTQEPTPRNNSSDLLICNNNDAQSFLDSTSSCHFTSSQQSSDCYITLGECYSGQRLPPHDRLAAASNDNFFSGRCGSLKRRGTNGASTFDRTAARNRRESRSYSNLTGDYYGPSSSFRHGRQHRNLPASRPPTIVGRQQPPKPSNVAGTSRLAVPGRARSTKTVFLNNSFASSRPFLEPDRNSYINFDSKWERNSRTVPLHPRQSSSIQRNSRWYERRLEVQLPGRSGRLSFESDSSCDDGDVETSPSTFNEQHSYIDTGRAATRKPQGDYNHHTSLHYLDLDLDLCCLDDSDRNDSRRSNDEKRSGDPARPLNSDATQYCKIDFCKTKGLQETRIDVESERRNSDRATDSNLPASFYSIF